MVLFIVVTMNNNPNQYSNNGIIGIITGILPGLPLLGIIPVIVIPSGYLT